MQEDMRPHGHMDQELIGLSPENVGREVEFFGARVDNPAKDDSKDGVAGLLSDSNYDATLSIAGSKKYYLKLK